MSGAFIPPKVWKKYRKWLSTDNLPNRFKKTGCQPLFPAPFNEAAYLESKHLLDVENSPLVRDDALEKEMATHSSVLAWRIPGTVEPGGLLSMGLHRVGHD